MTRFAQAGVIPRRSSIVSVMNVFARELRGFIRRTRLTPVYLFTAAESQHACGFQPVEVRLYGDTGEIPRGCW